jgi:hypothetical protein
VTFHFSGFFGTVTTAIAHSNNRRSLYLLEKFLSHDLVNKSRVCAVFFHLNLIIKTPESKTCINVVAVLEILSQFPLLTKERKLGRICFSIYIHVCKYYIQGEHSNFEHFLPIMFFFIPLFSKFLK